MEHSGGPAGLASQREPGRAGRRYELIVVVFAAIVFLGGIFSPPSLMDDVDAVQAQIARNMLQSGDWVTARLDGVPYLEKSPLKYWSMAVSFMIFGVHDWSARIPIALCVILLCWLTARFGAWAFSARAGLYAGLSLATCVGLFLFTRILIPDAMLTLTIALAMWAFLRALEEDEPRPGLWASVLGASLGVGLLLKGLIAVVFPCSAAFVYLVVTRQLFARRTWRRLHPLRGALIALAIAAPWHVLATLRNPPYLDLTMRSEPGKYHGFFWFYFLNEHLFRFLNMRYPRDYNTVPRLWFWLFHLLWLFPWSVYFPALVKLKYNAGDRGGRTRLLALCWIGFLLAFFSFSTTQEYYSMPCYPALALLIGCAVAAGSRWITIGTRIAGTVAGLAAMTIGAILIRVRGIPTPGDISNALTSNPDAYTLSLGHMLDLTIGSFAYLRLPLAVAGVAFLVGALGAWLLRGRLTVISLAVMMALFLHAAHLALVTFDPYMSSRPLAEALVQAPPGKWICDDQYYTFSSVFFYTNRTALLLNGRVNNLDYGSYAPGAPDVFLTDQDLPRVWSESQRYYLTAESKAIPRLERLLGPGALQMVAASGGKVLLTNQPLTTTHADLR
jgi:4-amino-4-deoxy-L-arabinose transferase-like glycosyltransferase